MFDAGVCTCRSQCAYGFSFPELTYLDIHSCQDVDFSQDNTPNICALTALQKLRLSELDYFDPRLLDSYKAFLELRLTLASEDAAALLTVLSKLQKLRSLNLMIEENFQDAAPWEVEAAAFSALTANSQLEAPHLTCVPLPAQTAWRHMFAQGRRLPLLRALTLKPLQRMIAAGVGCACSSAAALACGS